MENKTLHKGKIVKFENLVWNEREGCMMAKPISAGETSENITCIVVNIPAGSTWKSCNIGKTREIIVVNHQGNGTCTVDVQEKDFREHDTLFSPTGTHYSVSADKGEDMRIFVWQSLATKTTKFSNNPRYFDNLYNDEIQLKGFQGNKKLGENANPANMNFLVWPGTGSGHLSLHCGIQENGQSFSVHSHEESEELFIGVEGSGEVYLNGEWHKFNAGDVLYSPQKLTHGTRNPFKEDSDERFVTCGGPVPFDKSFYMSANVSAEVK